MSNQKIITKYDKEYLESNGVEFEILGYKPIVRDTRENQPKFKKGICDICGNAFGDLKLRDGKFFCNNCRINNRIEAFMVKHSGKLSKTEKESILSLFENASDVDDILTGIIKKIIELSDETVIKNIERFTKILNDTIKDTIK